MPDITDKITQEYDASQIQVLEGLEAVRKRPGMYIGSTSSSGLHHLVYEIVDNSIDEALAGYCSHIELTIEPGDIICFSDNGSGNPVDIPPPTGTSALAGDPAPPAPTARCQPAPVMFEDTVYDYETLHVRMREQAFLNAGLRITITDQRGEEPVSESMCYEGGIREFVDFINKNKTALHPEAIYMAGERSDSMCEIALQYNDGYNEVIVSFANNIHTPEGGMHETGFKAALTRALNTYGKKSGILKEGDSISGEDSRAPRPRKPPPQNRARGLQHARQAARLQ